MLKKVLAEYKIKPVKTVALTDYSTYVQTENKDLIIISFTKIQEAENFLTTLRYLSKKDLVGATISNDVVDFVEVNKKFFVALELNYFRSFKLNLEQNDYVEIGKIIGGMHKASAHVMPMVYKKYLENSNKTLINYSEIILGALKNPALETKLYRKYGFKFDYDIVEFLTDQIRIFLNSTKEEILIYNVDINNFFVNQGGEINLFLDHIVGIGNETLDLAMLVESFADHQKNFSPGEIRDLLLEGYEEVRGSKINLQYFGIMLNYYEFIEFYNDVVNNGPESAELHKKMSVLEKSHVITYV